MKIRKYNPADGQAFQGDVSIIPIPADVAIATAQEIPPIEGRLILQEGEVSGHHHAIDLRQRHFQAQPRETGDPLMATHDPKPQTVLRGPARMVKVGRKLLEATERLGMNASVRLYRDDAVVSAMVGRGILTRSDLAIGCLVIEGPPMLLGHEEHDAIELPAGKYLIGRQVESVGAEERRVYD